jgi:hypothetical protein
MIEYSFENKIVIIPSLKILNKRNDDRSSKPENDRRRRLSKKVGDVVSPHKQWAAKIIV